MRRYSRIKRKVKTVIGRYDPGVIVLMYHRVTNLASSPYHGIVSIDHFDQQMEYLRNNCQLIKLTDLEISIKTNSLPKRGVIVTFDDGYADNYHHAYPVLQRYQVPATIFITSDYIDSQREFWWDELERILILPDKLPEVVPLSIGAQGINLNFARFDPEQRILLLRSVHNFLRSFRPVDRDAFIDAIRAMIGIEPSGRKSYRPMTKSEIVELSQSELVDIGAHTMSHPVLSTLSRDDQRDEILGSISTIEAVIGMHVASFAYPFGSPQDINSESVDIIRSSGIKFAVTTTPGIVKCNCDCAQLPRVWIGDWDIDYFAQQIENYFF